MNREELVAEIAKQTKLTQKSVGEVLTAIIDVTQDTVKKGEKVTLVGFGTFEPRKRAARNGRNPQTGETIKIEAKTVPTFSAGKKFKEIVKEGGFEDDKVVLKELKKSGYLECEKDRYTRKRETQAGIKIPLIVVKISTGNKNNKVS